MFKLRASFSLLQMTLHQLSKLLLVHKYVLISEYNKNNTLVKGFILLWKDKLNPKYLRILNNVLVFLWNDEMILKMLFAMNEETICQEWWNNLILMKTNLLNEKRTPSVSWWRKKYVNFHVPNFSSLLMKKLISASFGSTN